MQQEIFPGLQSENAYEDTFRNKTLSVQNHKLWEEIHIIQQSNLTHEDTPQNLPLMTSPYTYCNFIELQSKIVSLLLVFTFNYLVVLQHEVKYLPTSLLSFLKGDFLKNIFLLQGELLPAGPNQKFLNHEEILWVDCLPLAELLLL